MTVETEACAQILTFAGTALGQKPVTATEAKQMVEDALAYVNDV